MRWKLLMWISVFFIVIWLLPEIKKEIEFLNDVKNGDATMKNPTLERMIELLQFQAGE